MSAEPELLSGPALDAANRVYATLGFQPSKAAADSTYGVQRNGAPIALGRIQRHPDGEHEVGGFWVHEDQRGTGLARRLVRTVLDALPPGSRAWCIPFEHLEPFYRSFGMQPFPRDAAPESIRSKLAYCDARRARGEYHPVRLLRYERP